MITTCSACMRVTQDTTVRELLRSNEILTLGAASKHVDWQRLWSAVLNADDFREGARDSESPAFFSRSDDGWMHMEQHMSQSGHACTVGRPVHVECLLMQSESSSSGACCTSGMSV